MASTVDTYGQVSCNSVEVDSTIKFTGSTDDTKSISLTLAGDPSAAGDVVMTLPAITTAQTLLHDGSTIDAANVDINGATAETTPVDADEFLMYDASNTANRKVTGANLKTYVGASALSGATQHQILAADVSGDMQQYTVSGDLTNNAGAFTIANDAVTGAKIADLGVSAGKYAAGSIDNADINASAAIAHSKLAAVTDGNILVGNGSNVPVSVAVSGDISLANDGTTAISSGVIVNDDVNASAAISGSKVDPNFAAQDVTTTGNYQTNVSGEYRFGADTNGSWKIDVAAGGGQIQFLKKEAGVWVVKGSFSA